MEQKRLDEIRERVDAATLVRALRVCGDPEKTCMDCPYDKRNGGKGCTNKNPDAANLIEVLAAEVARLTAELTAMTEERTEAQREIDGLTDELTGVRIKYAIISEKNDDLRGRLLTQTTENVRLGKEVVTQTKHTIQARKRRDEYQQQVIDAGPTLLRLQTERDAWKARCEAAEQALNALRKKSGWKCYACYYDNHSDRDVCVGCGYNDGNNWRWRGPVEGGEGV